MDIDIGKKIYNLRTAKLMTQAELAGDHITRNMLCLIEKGAANPSLSTILYIAKRLNVSAGYLLADSDEELFYNKSSKIENIKKALSNEDYEICRDLCMECVSKGSEDDEISLILAEVNIAIAQKEIFAGRLKSAIDYIGEALEYCEKTIYYSNHIKAQASVYSAYMSKLAPSLDMGLGECTNNASDDPFYKYMTVFCGSSALEKENADDEFKGSIYFKHLVADELMSVGKYDEAFASLSEILRSDDTIPRTMLYSIFSDLEKCCKEREDFKGAYEYSTNKIQLFEKMLSDN